MKFTRDKARPISADTGLLDMEAAVMEAASGGGLRALGAAPQDRVRHPGHRHAGRHRPSYIEHLLTYIDRDRLRPLKIVVNAGQRRSGTGDRHARNRSAV